MLTVAGYGYVGQAYANLLSRAHTINIYDPAKGFDTFGAPGGAVICVSTPQSIDGSCSVDNVLQAISLIPDDNIPILIKSTISLEGWDKICNAYPYRPITFSPEFLRADTALSDVLEMKDVFIGGGDLSYWTEVFRRAAPNVNVRVSEPRALILSKYMRNSFLSLKVSFFNQVFDFCRAANIDFENVRYVVGQDMRIGDSHSFVTEERGFGGHCFPKDNNALLSTAKTYGVDLSLVEESVKYNNLVRRKST